MTGTYAAGTYGDVVGTYADLDGGAPYEFLLLEAVSSVTFVETGG
jgi:hypothetical protein